LRWWYHREKEAIRSTNDDQSNSYLVEEEYLVTALVPSETACLASSPGRMRRTLEKSQRMNVEDEAVMTYEVWISREEMVDFLL
jgi:hypothetical protein